MAFLVIMFLGIEQNAFFPRGKWKKDPPIIFKKVEHLDDPKTRFGKKKVLLTVCLSLEKRSFSFCF